MLLNILIASLIPFVVWVIQKLTGKTGPKATYIRRRIFAYGLLFIFILSIFDFYLIFQKIQEDTQGVNALSRYFDFLVNRKSSTSKISNLENFEKSKKTYD